MMIRTSISMFKFYYLLPMSYLEGKKWLLDTKMFDHETLYS